MNVHQTALAQGVFLAYLDFLATQYKLLWISELGVVLAEDSLPLPQVVFAYAEEDGRAVLVTDEWGPAGEGRLYRRHRWNPTLGTVDSDTLFLLSYPVSEAYSNCTVEYSAGTLTIASIFYLADAYPLVFRLYISRSTASGTTTFAPWDLGPVPAASFTSGWTIIRGPGDNGILGCFNTTELPQRVLVQGFDNSGQPAGLLRELEYRPGQQINGLTLASNGLSLYSMVTAVIPDGSGPGGVYLAALPLDSLFFTSGTPAGPVPAPRELTLSAYPNPFNAAVRIEFDLPPDPDAALRIFDLTGREVAAWTRLAAGESRSILWQAEGLPSGLYFARLQSGKMTRTQKLVLLK